MVNDKQLSESMAYLFDISNVELLCCISRYPEFCLEAEELHSPH